VPKFRSMVEEGGTYELHNAIVGFNEGKYKLTSHKHKLSMLHNSSFTKKDLPTIPINVFEFISFNEILSSTVQDTSVGKTSIMNVCCALLMTFCTPSENTNSCFCFSIHYIRCYWSCNWKGWSKGNWIRGQEEQSDWSHFARFRVSFIFLFVPLTCNTILIEIVWMHWLLPNFLLQKQSFALLSLGWTCWQNCQLFC
jgi:hypothetical protein